MLLGRTAFLGSLASEPAPLPAYTAEAWNFNGSSYLSASSMTGAADGNAFTASFWVYQTAIPSAWSQMFSCYDGTNYRFVIQVDDTNTLRIPIRNSAGTTICSGLSTQALPTNQWCHVLISMDFTTDNKYIYFNDTDVTGAFTLTNSNYDFTTTAYAVGARAGTFVDKFTGDMAELWFDQSFIDISVEANRRKFRDANGLPVNLDTDGSAVTGSAPLIYLNGPATDVNVNHGSGSNYTKNGTISDSTTEPVQLPSYTSEAVTFDGTDTMTGTMANSPADSGTITASWWFYIGDDQKISQIFFAKGATDAKFWAIYNNGSVNGNLAINGKNAAGTVILASSLGNSTITANTWHHMAVSIDMSDQTKCKYYLDDVAMTPTFNTFVQGSTFGWYGSSETEWDIGHWNGGQAIQGCDMAELWVAPGQYFDVSVEANRRKFISSTGSPVDLGSDGSTPTATSPLIYIKGDNQTWNAGSNSGTGGSFTMTGSVANSLNEPVSI